MAEKKGNIERGEAEAKKNAPETGGKARYFGSKRFFGHVVVGLAIIIPTTIAIMLALRDNNETVITGDPPGEVTEIPNEVTETPSEVTEPPAVQTTPREVLGTPSGRGVLITPENVESIREQMEQPIEDAYYTTYMNVEWEFDRWDAPSRNAFVANDTSNVRTVYFDVILDSTGETVYSSPFIEVGARLNGFALDSYVPPGEHQATVLYTLVDDDFNDLPAELSVLVILKIAG